jgi:DNA-binding NtrC family response regulator
MAKDTDQRYQSSQGILSDLELCLESKPRSDTYSFTTTDQRQQFHISGKLYGRSQQIEQLNNEVKLVCQGQARLLTIHGPSGTPCVRIVVA